MEAAIQVPAGHIIKTIKISLTHGLKAKKYHDQFVHKISPEYRIFEANQLCAAWCIEGTKKAKYKYFVVWVFGR